MAAQQPPDDRSGLDAEHEALKRETAALRREHERLHTLGGSKAEHQEHVRNLRLKIKELEAHVERLKSVRKSR